MNRPAQAQWRELLLLALLALLWGSSYLFLKVAVAEIPPVTLIAMRVSVAAVFLLAVLYWRGERLPADWHTWRLLFIQSFFNSFGAWTLLAWGQQFVDASLASVLNSTSPIFVVLITVLFMRPEPVAPIKIFGAVLGLCGVVLTVGLESLAGFGHAVAGQCAALGAAAMYGYAALFGRRFARLPAAVTAAGSMIWATVVLVPASLVIDRPWHLRPSAEALSAALALGILCTGIALILYFRLVRTLGSVGVASQAYLRAGVGVMLGMVLLGETLRPTTLLGIGLALAGVLAINIPATAFARLLRASS